MAGRDLRALEQEILRLTPQERKQLLDRCSVLDSLRKPTEDPDLELVYSAVAEYFLAKGVKLMPLGVLRKQRIDGPLLVRVTPIVVHVLREDLQLVKTVHEKQVLGVLLQTVAKAVKKRNLPIKPRYVLQALGDLPALVDQAFPGYRESGLLPFVGKRMTGCA